WCSRWLASASSEIASVMPPPKQTRWAVGSTPTGWNFRPVGRLPRVARIVEPRRLAHGNRPRSVRDSAGRCSRAGDRRDSRRSGEELHGRRVGTPGTGEEDAEVSDEEKSVVVDPGNLGFAGVLVDADRYALLPRLDDV